MGFFSGIASIAKDIVKSPITKAAVGGAAIVFPPVGVPAAAAVASANVALSYADRPEGKAILNAADKLVAKKKTKAKVTLMAAAKAQVRRGVPPATAKVNMLHKARALAPKLHSAGGAGVAQRRNALAAQLKRTAQLAAKGDVGARRALATFKVVSAARKGDPKAKAAVALIAHRWEVGQRVRSRFELTAHGRIRARV